MGTGMQPVAGPPMPKEVGGASVLRRLGLRKPVRPPKPLYDEPPLKSSNKPYDPFDEIEAPGGQAGF